MKETDEVKVVVKLNGPLIIQGKLNVELSDGSTKQLERLVICRCGASGSMPFCDASHNRIGFSAE